MKTGEGTVEELSILISEDDPDDQYLFKSACHEVATKVKIYNVLTGRQLVQNLLEIAVSGRDKGIELPSLIIADLKKPFFELEIIKEIRLYTQFKSIPIYIFSMDGSEALQVKSLAAGAAGFYKKPSTYFDLKTIMRSIINKIKS
jgi:CheY-like chemotaxis protein